MSSQYDCSASTSSWNGESHEWITACVAGPTLPTGTALSVPPTPTHTVRAMCESRATVRQCERVRA
jgi:hypothetical protein